MGCKNCGNEQVRSDGLCSTGCFNTFTKTKGVDGWRDCKDCGDSHPFRNSLIERGRFSKKLNRRIWRRDQEFCSQKCLLGFRNREENPAQDENGRRKISKAAKERGTEHMNTLEARKKQRESISGEGHWNWQGGITPENRRRRNLAEYAEWRTEVFERDDYSCQECGARSGNGKAVTLNADHIKPWSLCPELRLDLDNGRTLCLPCHKKTDTYMGRIKQYKEKLS